MDDVLSVPIELLVFVFKFLSARDLVAASRTCRRFREAALVDVIWQEICKRGFDICSYDGWGVSCFRELYSLVIHKYGGILGLWKANIPRYGGLVHITAESGRMLATLYRAPYSPKVTHPLRPRELFSLSLHGGSLRTHCLTGWNEEADKEHLASVHIKSTKKGRATSIEFRCHASENHNVRSEMFGTANYLQKWLKDEYDNENILIQRPDMVQLALLKYTELHSLYSDPILFYRLNLPTGQLNTSVVVKPGVYKGTYSAHGLELVLLEVTENRVTATKITGDPNIPAGQVTFDVSLRDPSFPEDPRDPSDEKELAEEQRPRPLSGRMPFNLPRSFTSDFSGFPSSCISRYQGAGQVAYHNYSSPRLTPGELIVFSDDLVGFLWHELLAFSVFSRCTEDFLQR
ncbi:F-box only protein 31 [Nematostella vectensis]|uniref:F-box only protein 31 n=1 Tax=Nematostella vectensis TaxID=45351 RepID=UPI00207795F1|nr:F-box only protein 31 [Nematostella vectensis]